MHDVVTLSHNQVIRPGEEFSDRGMDTATVNLNASPTTKLRVIVEVRDSFPHDTKLNIQLIESHLTNLSGFGVLSETGDLSEADLKVGAIPLIVGVKTTGARFLGLRYVSKGNAVGGVLMARVIVERSWSTTPQAEPARVRYRLEDLQAETPGQ